MLHSGPITVVAVCIAATHSCIFGEVHVRLQLRVRGSAVLTASVQRRSINWPFCHCRAGGDLPTKDAGQQGEAEEEEQPSPADEVRSARVLNDVPSAEAFIRTAPVTVVGFLKDPNSLEAEAFGDVVRKMKRLSFAVTYNTTVWEKFNISRNTITLFKKFDEGRADYLFEEGHLKPSVTKIVHFLGHNELRLVTEYNPTHAGQIFGSGIPTQLLLLVSKTSKEYQPLLEKFKGVAPEFRGKVIFVLVDTDKKENQRVTAFFKVMEPDFPAICLFHVVTDAVKVMKISDISPDLIRRFYTNFIEGIEELPKKLPSEEL